MKIRGMKNWRWQLQLRNASQLSCSTCRRVYSLAAMATISNGLWTISSWWFVMCHILIGYLRVMTSLTVYHFSHLFISNIFLFVDSCMARKSMRISLTDCPYSLHWCVTLYSSLVSFSRQVLTSSCIWLISSKLYAICLFGQSGGVVSNKCF